MISELVTYAFNTLGLKYIGAQVEEANIPMQKALLKVGFEQDGFFKEQRVKDGKRIDVVHFGVKAE